MIITFAISHSRTESRIWFKFQAADRQQQQLQWTCRQHNCANIQYVKTCIHKRIVIYKFVGLLAAFSLFKLFQFDEIQRF